jgi:hypothetical protein
MRLFASRPCASGTEVPRSFMSCDLIIPKHLEMTGLETCLVPGALGLWAVFLMPDLSTATSVSAGG